MIEPFPNSSLSHFAAPRDGEKVGLVAGWGRFPIVVAENLTRRGFQVYCAGIAGHVDPALANTCDDFKTVGLTRMGAQIRYFRSSGVKNITLAGKIHKVLLFNRDFIWHHIPDITCIRTFFPHYISRTKLRSDDSMLSAVVNGYEKRGLHVKAATDLVPELLIQTGQLSGAPITKSLQQDIDYGWQLAKSMGGLDVGQSVAVKGRAVLAVEAVEGTDQCIRRAGLLCPSGGFTVVKVAKPEQDMRFDVPTIGIGTLQSIAAAGGSVLAIEANKTIIVDEKQVVAYAQKHGITIVALQAAAPAIADAA